MYRKSWYVVFKDKMMKIIEIQTNKRLHMELLLLADEQLDMIETYLERGTMFVLDDNGVKAECVVTDEGNSVIEIKNIATYPAYKILRVGTGDSPLTIPFYKKCGFSESYRVKNFFTDHYDHPIYECGIQLVDMVYLEKYFIWTIEEFKIFPTIKKSFVLERNG